MGYPLKVKLEARELYAQGYSYPDISKKLGIANFQTIWFWKSTKAPDGIDWDEEARKHKKNLEKIIEQQREECLSEFEQAYWETEKLQWGKLKQLLNVWSPTEAVLERTTIGGKKVKVIDEEATAANAVPYDMVKMADALYKRLRNERGLPGKTEEHHHKFSDLEKLSDEELDAILDATRNRNSETDAG